MISKLLIMPIIQFQLIQVSCLLSTAGNLLGFSIICMFIVKSQINLDYYHYYQANLKTKIHHQHQHQHIYHDSPDSNNDCPDDVDITLHHPLQLH